MLDELLAILEKVGTELPTSARQIMKSVEIQLAGKLSDYTGD
jgi:hypothetical protein